MAVVRKSGLTPSDRALHKEMLTNSYAAARGAMPRPAYPRELPTKKQKNPG